MKKLFPITITEKLEECADFYETYFHFKIVFKENWYIHLAHENGMEIGLMAPNLENQPSFLHSSHQGQGILYSFEVEDASKEYKRLKSSGVNIIHDLKDEVWGQRHFILKDPAGVYVDVVEQLKI
jgi:uncharacterized glyoxalase superfamily protein PhnB